MRVTRSLRLGEYRVAVGDEQGDDGQAGEGRQRLACCRDGRQEGQAGEHPGERAGDKGDAERTAGAVERGQEMARPPQAEAAEQKGTGLESKRGGAGARSRDGEDLRGQPEQDRADREAGDTGQQPLAIQEIHERAGPLMPQGDE
jgi:hypothetical protein